MTDLEKRAHDITIRILPMMMKEEHIDFIAGDKYGNPFFNAGDITDLYRNVYEDLLTELRHLEEF